MVMAEPGRSVASPRQVWHYRWGMDGTRRARARAVLFAAGVCLLTGCASEWERAYVPSMPSDTPHASLGADAQVRIRDVPWQRIDGALRELEAERAASDAPPDEWPPEKQEAAKQKLLTALQVTAPASEVEILGRSVFRTTSDTNPHDGELAAFARKIGADTVVWASNYLGKTQVVRDEPVSEWRSGTWSSGRHGSRRSDTFTENSTIWVPVVVEADEHAFIAYFLRGAR